jgi:phosphoribosylaminoimidazole-succinocarboxamide synthase
MEPARGAALYEGKSKRVYATDDPRLVIMHYKDDATAFNGQKKASIADKGRVNCAMTIQLFGELERHGVKTHLVRPLGERELLVRRVEVVPVEVVVRNVAAGSLAKRYGITEGTPLAWPLVEWFYKSDALGDPLMIEDHAVLFGWAERRELAFMKEQALVVNGILTAWWAGLGVDLIDFKLEFGRLDGNLVLADEITPDGCRLWEKGTGKKLDKDVFRRDLGDLSETYRDLYKRVFGSVLGAAEAS